MHLCKAVLFFSLILQGQNLFADSLSMPQMPSMPSVSSPSINSSSVNNQTAKSQEKTSQTKKQTSSVTAASLLQMNSSNPFGSITDLNSILSNLSTEKTTEADLSTLSTLSTQLLNSNSTSNSLSSNVILTEILKKLETMQEQLDKINDEPKSEQKEKITSTENEKIKAQKQKILRFKINNYDLTKSFTTLFFSEQEADGSFLLTGDRVYNLYGKQMSETFYMLFKNKKGNNFEVAVALTQNDENQHSFLYRLSKDSPYEAQCTGNLFFVNHNQNDLKVDILIEQ